LRRLAAPLQQRCAFLTRLAELLEERAETYGRLVTAEMGKPLADSLRFADWMQHSGVDRH
jgi:acyl-CoA reductase-like NAD-dependent aldehyde dehydrogenase